MFIIKRLIERVDTMAEQNLQAVEMLKKKFEQFKRLKEALGEEKSWEKIFEGYPERQRKKWVTS